MRAGWLQEVGAKQREILNSAHNALCSSSLCYEFPVSKGNLRANTCGTLFLMSRPLKTRSIVSFLPFKTMCFNVEDITCAAVVCNLDGYRVPDLFVVHKACKQLKINVTPNRGTEVKAFR